MPERIMLIVNPVSGKGRARTALSGILQDLCTGGRSVTVYMTEYPGHAEELASGHGAEFDVVACTGGDGTLSGIINGLMRLPQPRRPRVGYIPLGTTNDMATSFGIPRLPRVAAKRILEGAPVTVDIGKSAGGYFGYVMAFGAFISVSYETPQETKNAFGRLAYFWEGAASLQKLSASHMRVEYDGGVLEGDYIFGAVSNSTSVAGLLRYTPRQAVLNDGLFEVMLIQNPDTPAMLNETLAALLSQTYDTGGITLLHTRRARFTSDRDVPWTRDGESGGALRVMEAEVCPSAMQIML